ncbi:MAG: hypothetical protein WEB00_12325 [Dehalococcoidia bacterium]
MRILSIGFALPGRGFDNHNIVNAPAFFDYDALVVDPVAVSQSIEEIAGGGADFRTGDNQVVANLSSSPLVVGLDSLLQSRRQQTELLLRRGGTIVVAAAPDVAHSDVVGLPGYRRYSWLPAPEGREWRDVLSPAFGKGCRVADASHAFGAYAEYAGKRCAYRAFFVEGSGDMSVFARSEGGAAIGVELSVGNGRVVFVPAPREISAGAARAELATVIHDCLSRLSDLRSEEEEPGWASALPLPGLEQLEAAEAEAGEKREEAAEAYEAARLARKEVSDMRRLVWAEGPALAEAVRSTLTLLGFSTHDDEGIAVTEGGYRLLVEAAGSDGAVGLEAHHRLRARRERELEGAGQMPGGILVVTGWREQEADERGQEYDDALAIAAEGQRYCLLTGGELLQAGSVALAGGAERAAELRAAIAGTEGRFELPASARVPEAQVASGAPAETEA